jgi:hypothetical protein
LRGPGAFRYAVLMAVEVAPLRRYVPGEAEWQELLAHLDLRATIRLVESMSMPVVVGPPVDFDEIATLGRERMADLALRLRTPPFEPLNPRHRILEAFVAEDPDARARLAEFVRARVERITAEMTELRREIWRALAAGDEQDRRLAAIDRALVPTLQPVILRRVDARIEREAERTARAFARVSRPFRASVARIHQVRRWHRFLDGFFSFERTRLEPLLARVARAAISRPRPLLDPPSSFESPPR